MSEVVPHRPWLGSARIFAAELLILPTGLVTAGFLTRQLGPDAYGLLTLAVTTVGWLQWTAVSMMSRASNRTIAAAGDWRPVAAEVVQLHVLVGSVLGLMVLLLAPWMTVLLEQPTLTTPLRLMAIDLPLLVVAQGYRGVLFANGEHQWLSMVSAVRWIVRMLSIIGLVSLGWSIDGAIGGIVLSSVASLVLSRWRVGALPRASHEERRRVRAGLLSLAVPIAVAAIGSRLFERTDLFLLAAFGGSAASLGHYGAAQNLTVMFSLLAGTVSPIVLATLTRMRRTGDHHEARLLQQDVMRLPYLLLPFSALAAGAATEIMGMVYGASFLDAAPLFALLILGSTALVAVSVSTVLLVAIDRAWLVVGLTGPMLVALIVATLVLMPRYGPVGPALASLLVSAGAALVGQLLVARVESVRVPLRSMAVSAALSILAFGAARAWSTRSSMGTLVELSTISVALVSALVLLREIPSHLRSFVSGVVQPGA